LCSVPIKIAPGAIAVPGASLCLYAVVEEILEDLSLKTVLDDLPYAMVYHIFSPSPAGRLAVM